MTTADYKVCQKEKRLQTSKMQTTCVEYRWLANKCYFMDESEFIDHLLDKLEKRRKYADYLEMEGSVLAKTHREKQTIFRMRNTTHEGDQVF